MTTDSIATPVAGADWRPYAAFIGCSVIWGSTFLAIRIGNEAVPPLWAATLRLALATVLLFGVARVTGARIPRGASLRDILLYGLFQFGGNFGLLYWGEAAGVPSGITAVVFATIPLSTALFALAFGLERLDLTKTLYAAAGLAGVAVIFAGQLGSGVPLAGLVAVIGACTSAALSSVFLKRAQSRSPFMANSIGSAVGVVVCCGAALALGESIALPLTLAGWAPILYLTLMGSLGAYVLMAWLLTKWTVTSTSLIGVVIPLIAVTLGALVRDERLQPIELAGAAMVIASVVASLKRGAAH